MSVPANSITLGENAYLLNSTHNEMFDCLVIAHGGILDDNRQFKVPAEVTIVFFVEPNETHEVAELEDLIKTRQALVTTRYAAAALCPDYILSKALGMHFEGDSMTYSEVRTLLDADTPGHRQNWLPHIVTVRNRTSIFKKQYIWLSTLINLIRAAKPNVTTIYCTNCRNHVNRDKDAHYRGSVGAPALESAVRPYAWQ